jgi:hypothetical protein
MTSVQSALSNFFGVMVRSQTYLNALYLLLAFPLGLAYFLFLITGISLGFALLIVWVGLLILVLVIAGWYGLIFFERWLAIHLLHEDIPPMSRRSLNGLSLWQQFTAMITNPVTWKGLAYLLARFPLGILFFTILVTLVSVSGALLAAPFYYTWFHPQIQFGWNGLFFNPIWVIDTLPEALLASLIGIFAVFVSMHIVNGLAWVSAKFARVMLGTVSNSDPGTPPQTRLPSTVEVFTPADTTFPGAPEAAAPAE